MKVRLLLAHSAEVQQGLLYALGVGWTQFGPGPAPFAVAALVEVTWEETNRPYRFEIVFEDADGLPLLVPTPAGDQQIRIGADFVAGRPPDGAPGTSFTLPVAIPMAPVPFPPGRHCIVRALVNDTEYDRVGFVVRPVPGAQPGLPPQQPLR